MQVRDLPDDSAVRLLRERRVNVAGAQSGFKVDHRDLTVEGRHRRCHRGGGISLGNDSVGLLLGNDAVEASNGSGHDLVEALALLHQREVMVGGDSKHAVDLIEHFSVLARRDRH